LPNLEACVLLSLRRRGQLLLVTSALVGVVAGASLGMVAESAETTGSVAVVARERGASGVAASASPSQPSGPRSTAQRSRADNGSTGKRSSLADRAGRHHKAGNGKHDRGRPADRQKGKPGKDR
jgi:hypothetical protein